MRPAVRTPAHPPALAPRPPTPARARRRAGSRARGFNLTEALVAILVFAFGVLGAVGMQTRALQASAQNDDRSRASLLANELVAQMWLARTTSLDPRTVAAWQARVGDARASGLPGGVGGVSLVTGRDGTTTATVVVRWTAAAPTGASAPARFVTTVVMP